MNQSAQQTDTALSIDALPAAQALSVMLASHRAALLSVEGALDDIATAASAVADALENGATLHYAAAGSSGLMALADACELPGTFRVPQEQIRIHMAGGVPADGAMPGDTEDSAEDAASGAAQIRDGDVAIVVSASGTTPYALSFADCAHGNGARVIGIANVAGSELLGLSDIAISVPSAPEVLDGSTRLGAGTAQKVVLNMISTQVGVLLGHVHDGMMVNLNPDNIKLRKRAEGIVARIAGVDGATAATALEKTGYDTKAAALVALGLGAQDATGVLARHSGRLRSSLDELESGKPKN